MAPEQEFEPEEAPAKLEEIEVLVLPRFLCSSCYHEMILLPEMLIIYCNSPFCVAYQIQVSAGSELTRVRLKCN